MTTTDGSATAPAELDEPDKAGDSAKSGPADASASDGRGQVAEPLAAARRWLPLSAPLAYGGGVATGLLYWLAFPGVDLWPLAFVAWIPLLIAMHGQTPRRAALVGWAAGITMNVAGFWWLQGMLSTFSGFPAPICFLFLLIVCAFQGGRIALQGWLYGRANARGWPQAPVFAAAFAASELLYPVLFLWYFSATVHRVPVLTQTAEIGGAILVGLVVVAVNLTIAEPILARLERRRAARTVVAVGAGTLALACAYGALRIRAVDATVQAAPGATVGLAQANMGLIEKRALYDEGLRRHLDLSADLRARGADFVVWSETSAMRPVRDSSYDDELRSVSSRIGLPAIFGAVIIKHVADEREYVLYNSAVSSDASGHIRGRYDKEFLLMFGEYLPFGETFPILYGWSPNSGRFTPGTTLDPLVVDVKGEAHPVTALICYEDILPRFTNDAVRHAHPELIVNLTNDAWFGDTEAPWEHFALAELRAVEHRRYLVRGTNSGVSGVIDPVGRVVAHTGTFRTEAITAPIHWMRSHTVYESVGDWPWLLVSIGLIYAAFRPRRVTAGPLPAARSSAT
jgi:apolipoprotein N-acyltransferase